MKSLYESILDDEVVLTKNAMEISRNWLLVLKHAILNKASEEDLKKIINQDNVKNEVSKIFYKFDNRMHWIAGYMNTSIKSAYCILRDTKERVTVPKPVLMFVVDDNEDIMRIHIADISSLSKTASKNVKPTELLKFKQYLLKLGAKYTKTGYGKILENVLEI